MTTEEIDKIVEKYGEDNLNELEIPKDDSHSEFLNCLAVRPDRAVFGQYMKFQSLDPDKADEILVNNCLLENKEMVKANDFMFLTTVALISKMIPLSQGKIERFEPKDENEKALAGKHGLDKLRILEIPKDENENDTHRVICLIPSRTVVGQFRKYQDTNPVKAQNYLLKGCLLTHKDVVLADDFLFNTTVSTVSELLPIGEGRVKKFSRAARASTTGTKKTASGK